MRTYPACAIWKPVWAKIGRSSPGNNDGLSGVGMMSRSLTTATLLNHRTARRHFPAIPLDKGRHLQLREIRSLVGHDHSVEVRIVPNVP